jgi:hypothetical protein
LGEHFSSYSGIPQEEFLLRHYHRLFSLDTSALETWLGSNNSKSLTDEVIADSPLTLAFGVPVLAACKTIVTGLT